MKTSAKRVLVGLSLAAAFAGGYAATEAGQKESGHVVMVRYNGRNTDGRFLADDTAQTTNISLPGVTARQALTALQGNQAVELTYRGLGHTVVAITPRPLQQVPFGRRQA